ncbi:MAG: methyltransferase domain-containing protein [Mycobacteriales bacterium]|nr:methyltransferase domain-containing protein [Mycobacteriales bacterium]
MTNKDVLDLGSGEGYGADLLARTARSVVGVDIAPEAVEHARRRYGRDHVTFVQGSMIDTSSIEPDSCDVVVCFEALEHVVEHQELLAVVHKALRPGGLFVTSTPEPTAYNEDRSHGANPYHVGELTRAELAALLSDSFAHVTMLDQRIAVGSLVTSAGPGPAQTTALAREGDGWIGVPTPPATYLLAVASDGDLPVVPTVSVLVDPELELVRGVQRRWYDVVDALKVKDERLAEATALADRRAADSRVNADVLRAELATLQAELVRARTQAREANEELSRLRQRVDRLRGSRVYRGYRALRAGVSTFRTGAAVI